MKPLTASELRALIQHAAYDLTTGSASKSKAVLLQAAQRLLELIEELPEI